MKKTIKTLILMAAVSVMAAPVVAADLIDGAALFSKKCKMCHALDKKKSGPAITAMSQDEAQLRDVITNGGKSKMMKAYGKKYSSDQIDALVAYIRSKQ
jgi:cytochrome c553